MTSPYLLYLITTPEKKLQHLYKIGYHQGTLDTLLKQYQNKHLNPEIVYFDNVNNPFLIKNQVLNFLENYREKNRKSLNWICLRLEMIIATILYVCYNKNYDPMMIDY